MESGIPSRGVWFLQTLVAGAVMVPFWFVFAAAMGGCYDGGLSAFGLVFFSAGTAFVGISLASVLGLPLRTNRRALTWWRQIFWISPTLVVLGAALAKLSMDVAQRSSHLDECGAYDIAQPQPVLAIAGWFLMAFGLVHLWLPLREKTSSS